MLLENLLDRFSQADTRAVFLFREGVGEGTPKSGLETVGKGFEEGLDLLFGAELGEIDWFAVPV